jgi:hypothetical protein
MTRKKGNSFFCSFPEETTKFKFNSGKNKFVFAHTHEEGGCAWEEGVAHPNIKIKEFC